MILPDFLNPDSSLTRLVTFIFAWVGGIGAMYSLYRELTDRPKIVGSIEQLVLGEAYGSDGGFVGTQVMIQVIAVNKRLHPTSGIGFSLKFKTTKGAFDAKHIIIPDSLTLKGIPSVNWESNKFYEKAWERAFELEKPVRGWLRFIFMGLKMKDFKEGDKFILEIEDSLNRKYKIKHYYHNKKGELMYFPDSGVIGH